MNILVIDVGGTHVKLQATHHEQRVEFDSGPTMTPRRLVATVKRLTKSWKVVAISIGYPGAVLHGRIASEPHHLAQGWVGFDFRKAFGKRVRIINDAAMQALGSYRGKRMLFLGLGTGLGSALVINGIVEPMELAHLPYKKGRTYEEYVGIEALKEHGKKKWRKSVATVIATLTSALDVDYVVLGGGNARLMKELPTFVRLGRNDNAFTGGYRMWTPAYTRQMA